VAECRLTRLAERLLHDLLEASARRDPAAGAVLDGPRAFTYGELDGDANRIAATLVSLGVQVGDRVGLFIDKSYEAVAGVYGILKAGAAYVPLDPKGPGVRLGYIASNCDLRWIVTGASRSSRWQELVDAGAPVQHLICADVAGADLRAPEGVTLTRCDQEPVPSVAPSVPGLRTDDLAYVLYTSGSTGTPKGVMLSHGNGLAFVEWSGDAVGLTADDVVSSHAPLHFDLSIFDLYASAMVGATLVLVPAAASLFPSELVRFIRRTEITTWYSVPSILTMLVEKGGLTRGDLPSLRHVIFAGEVFPSGYLARLMHIVPEARHWNFYGPTETNVCTAYEVTTPPDIDGPDIPIGRPIRDVDVVIVDEDDRPVAGGEVGELLVGGPTVMMGYWADPDRTRRGLTSHPRLHASGTLAYRTGDLVVEEADGNLRFVGRRDTQVKSRGYRIELGEIESALRSHPDVVECAVVAEPDPLITNRLLALVVLRPDADGQDLRAHCGERIPVYMIPETFEIRTALPRTSTGKIDRQSLTRRSPRTAT